MSHSKNPKKRTDDEFLNQNFSRQNAHLLEELETATRQLTESKQLVSSFYLIEKYYTDILEFVMGMRKTSKPNLEQFWQSAGSSWVNMNILIELSIQLGREMVEKNEINEEILHYMTILCPLIQKYKYNNHLMSPPNIPMIPPEMFENGEMQLNPNWLPPVGEDGPNYVATLPQCFEPAPKFITTNRKKKENENTNNNEN